MVNFLDSCASVMKDNGDILTWPLLGFKRAAASKEKMDPTYYTPELVQYTAVIEVNTANH